MVNENWVSYYTTIIRIAKTVQGQETDAKRRRISSEVIKLNLSESICLNIIGMSMHKPPRNVTPLQAAQWCIAMDSEFWSHVLERTSFTLT